MVFAVRLFGLATRSVCLNLRESWAKRGHEGHFVNKLTDSDGENSETDSSLDLARDCGYIAVEDHKALAAENREVGRMLGSLVNNPDSFLTSPAGV